mmetsp:Transcript_1878/g.2860  ORF Transcript_1878/g.2860 Transcript_1878/m.2860 type:complete len:666 (+) Transcript_1878:197-2194(+)
MFLLLLLVFLGFTEFCLLVAIIGTTFVLGLVSLSLLLVGVFEHLNLETLEVFGSLLDVIGISLGDLAAELLNTLVQLLLLILGQPVLVFFQSLLGGVKSRFSGVNNFNALSPLSILLSVSLSFLNQVLDLALAKTTRSLKTDLLLLSGGVVTSRGIHDTVSINIEGDLNLGDSLGGRGDTDQLEVAEFLVVSAHITFTLEDNNVDLGLSIGGGRIHLGLFGGDGGVPGNQTREDTTVGFDTERERGDIKEKETGVFSTQDTSLDGGTHGNSLVGVNTLMGLLVENLLHSGDNLGGSGHTTDKNDLVDLRGGDLGVLQGLFAGLDGSLNQTINKVIILSTRNGHVKMLGSRGISGNVGEGDGGLCGGGELSLGLLSFLPQSLQGQNVSREIDSAFLLVFRHNVVLESLIEILSSEEGVAIGRFDLKHTITDFQDRDIKSTTSQIVHSNSFLSRAVFLGQTIGKSSSSRFVNDSLNIQTGNLTSVLGGLSLRVIKVSRHSDNSRVDSGANVSFSGFLHGGEDKGGNMLGRVRLSVAFNPCITVLSTNNFVGDGSLILLGFLRIETTTDQPLCGKEGSFGVGGSLTLGRDTNQSLTSVSEGNNRGSSTSTFSVLNHTRRSSFEGSDTGVGGTQIDTDDGVLAIRVSTRSKRGVSQKTRAEQSTTRQHG